MVMDEEDNKEKGELLPDGEDLTPVESNIRIRRTDCKAYDWCQKQQCPQRQINSGLLSMFSLK